MPPKKPTGTPGSTGSSGTRDLAERVKTAKGRKIASTLWLQRQLNDPYVQKARREGYRSRAAFKLAELDDQLKLIKKNMVIVDLGAAPGGWAQIAIERGVNKIVGIDILPVEPLPGAIFLEMDFNDNDAPDRLKDLLGGPADLVMSDLAPNTIGHKATDHIRQIAMVELALHFAIDVLKPGGHFIAKVFQGGTQHELLALMKRHFKVVKHIKPPSSRKESAELFVVAMGFKG